MACSHVREHIGGIKKSPFRHDASQKGLIRGGGMGDENKNAMRRK